MAEIKTFPKREYPANVQTLGTDNARPPSGYFSMFFTYPDTEYDDATDTVWAGGSTSQGMHFLIRTPLAGDTTAAATAFAHYGRIGVKIIDLKRAAEASTNAGTNKTYNLGTEEASRLIAATINSSRVWQRGLHSSRERFLRAKYVKMSGATSYTTINHNKLHYAAAGITSSAISADHAKGSTRVINVGTDISAHVKPNDSLYTENTYIGKVLEINGVYVYLQSTNECALTIGDSVRGGRFDGRFYTYNRSPTDLPQNGTITGGNYTLTYDGWEIKRENNDASLSNHNIVSFNITNVVNSAGPTANFAEGGTFAVQNDGEEQHTVIVSWETPTPTGGGYWGTANGGPIVQGLGAPLPVWYMTAKPMDGGNLGLPSLGYDSRGAQPSAHSTGHGYSRFSVEGLNSCDLPTAPPPDMPFDGPSIMGSTEADPFQWTGQNALLTTEEKDDLFIKKPEFGTKMDKMGPYQTDCFVSSNATLTGGTTINVVAPSTTAKNNFSKGDTLYNAKGTPIGVVSSIADTQTTALTTMGPLMEKIEVQINGDYASGTTTAITVRQDPTSLIAVSGDTATDKDGNSMGIITTRTTGPDTITFSAGTLQNYFDGDYVYIQRVNYTAGTGIDYTQTHLDENIPIVMASIGGTKEIGDAEAFGGAGTLADYNNVLKGNSSLFLDSNGEKYATVGNVSTPTASTAGGNRYSRMNITRDTLLKTIPTTTAAYRACNVITLEAAIGSITGYVTSLENGETLYKASQINKWQVALENGHKLNSKFGELKDATTGNHHTITNLTNSDAIANKVVVKHGLKSEATTISTSSTSTTGSQGYVTRPFRTVRAVNTETVGNLHISNEERVWDDLSVVDDTGQELVLQGGSPFGTVIKDYNFNKTRINPTDGTETILPSTPGSGIEPNMEIQLPSQDEIPGNILVRSGHDRVQAWRNMTWGMGGLTEPYPNTPGSIEANTDPNDTAAGGATQFDTHDRVLYFHPVRILHDKLATQFGLSPNANAGAVPSGSTRLFSAHRLNDHVERGSVLLDAQNGVDASFMHPHHRIRFGRQGHHFITPFTMRGTPKSLRRQLHRSHGSAYSLMFEAETENKHWGFQSAYNGGTDSPSSTLYYLDTLEAKTETYNTGSFSSDGFPLGEISRNGLPNHRKFYDDSPETSFDVLFAPGQEHTKVEGASEQTHFVSSSHGKDTSMGPYGNVAHSGPIAITAASARTVNTRHNAGEEFAINGFFLNQYLLMGGRPNPAWLQYDLAGSGATPHTYTLLGHQGGWYQPRVATELATVPPLFAHDVEMVNAAAIPIPIVENPAIDTAHFTQLSTNNDLALLKSTNTNSGATPDAFLSTWLAEYSHPALFGTSREHFMSFRYREAGMPNAVAYPAVRGLLLRNASSNSLVAGSVRTALPFERLYAFQWMQNYGYNALNAGGHGANWGERAASAVLMGHSGLREPCGTLELRQHFVKHGAVKRMSRGEGIGDGLNPRKTVSRRILDKDSTNNYIWHEVTTPENAMVAIDVSRRLPVRAWGFKTGSDALNMLSGDPNEILSTQQKIQKSARFDGGKHDSVQDIPTITLGADWRWPVAYGGVERSVPIGMVVSEHTSGEGMERLSNVAWAEGEKELGIGRVLKHSDLGVVKPTALPAGLVDSRRTEFTTTTGSSAKFLHAKSVNTGSDPIIGLNHHSGDKTLAANSVEAQTQSGSFGASVGNEFIHQRGNNLHLNAHPVDHFVNSGDNQHFPAHGWGQNLAMKNQSGASERGTMPIPLSEISDHRQVQSDLSPRLGLVVETKTERDEGKATDYEVTSTKAVSLHSDLAIGQQFPVLPSWVQQTKWTKYGASIGSITTTAANPDETYGGQSEPNQRLSKPQWSLNRDNNLGAAVLSDTSKEFKGVGVQDHWAVRGCGDLPPWGGVYILRKTWLERPDDIDASRASLKNNASGLTQNAQPVRKSADYIMRMVRPLKAFGYTTKNDVDGSVLNQDGWLLGAFSSLTEANFKHQPFTRDKRYGMFETTTAKSIGNILPITSTHDTSPTIEWPDANERDITWHLIPSANMLQHFKADASRKDNEGKIHSLIDARYSQSTHPGGGETLSQTETVYADNATLVLDPYNRRERSGIAVSKQPNYSMGILGSRGTIKFDSGTSLVVEDATNFPASGNLIIIGLSGQIPYTARTETTFTTGTRTGDCLSTGDLEGREIRFGNNANATIDSTNANLNPPTHSLVILPSFIDNSVSVSLTLANKWCGTNSDNSEVLKPNINYRGLGHYNPNDFFMATPQRFMLSNGQNSGVLSYIKGKGTGGLSDVYIDGINITESSFPPYLIDSDGKRLRIGGISSFGDGKLTTTNLKFRNLSGETIAKSGINTNEPVRVSHITAIGVRTTDAALMMMKDLGSLIPGMDLQPYRPAREQKRLDSGVYSTYSALQRSTTSSLSSYLSAHPSLKSTIEHSSIFISRAARGIGILDILRGLSQMDGYQLLLNESGLLLYSPNVFIGRDRNIGSSSGPQLIEVSGMLEMANEVIIEGDKIAENETVKGFVQDEEKKKKMGGKGDGEGVTRTARETIPGLREANLALRMAKGILIRTGQGAALIRVEGLLKSNDIQPGEIINVDFVMERIKGEFAVFEAHHDYTKGLSNLVIGQYEKGIEGLLADLQSSVSSTIDEDSTRTKERKELVFSAPIRIKAASRVMTRIVNNTRFLIGGSWRGSPTTKQLGAIGVSGGRTGVLKNGAISATTTTSLAVDEIDATLRFSPHDAVFTSANLLVGFVLSVTSTTVTLKANNLVAIPDNDELRATSARADPIGNSKSMFYRVK